MKRSDITVGQAVGLLVALALDILIFVPFAPFFPQEELDASWRFATNYALSHGFQFGKALIFTSGPLSFIYTRQYYPGYYVLMLALSALVIAAVTTAIWSAARPSHRWLILALPLLLAQVPDFDAVFLFVPLLLLWVACWVREGWAKTGLLAWLAVTCALLPLVKGSFAIAVVGIGALALATDGRRRPGRAAGLLALFLATAAAAWLACGQKPSTFPAYVTSEVQIVSGYTDAMSLPGPASEALVFGAAATLIVALCALASDRRPLACGLGLALALFLCFKAGFVRQDGHVLIATSGLLLAGLLVTLAGSGRSAGFALPLGLAAWCLVSWPYMPIDPLSDFSRFADAVSRSTGAISALATDRGSARRSFDAALAGVRARHPLERTAGTADLYPTDVAVVLANGLAWDPRPVIQSYSAYTDGLARLNADSLTRPNAPATIFFAVGSIDGRYPALDDGRSWPLLASLYRLSSLRGDQAELRRRAAPAETIIGAPLADRDADLGEQVPVPPGPIWAEVDVELSLAGRLISAAYKAPVLTLTIDYSDGTSRDFRFIAAVARGGFLLSPTVETTTDLLSLESRVTSSVQASRPVSFAISSDDPTGVLWRRRFHVVLKPIVFPITPDVDAVLFRPLKPYQGPLPPSSVGDCAVDAVAGHDGDDVRVDADVQTLNLRGWAMISAAQGKPNRGLSMAFISARGGELYAADLPKVPSPGLVEHFGTLAAADAAFDAQVDVRSLPAGRYRLRLIQDGDDGPVQCPHREIVLDRR